MKVLDSRHVVLFVSVTEWPFTVHDMRNAVIETWPIAHSLVDPLTRCVSVEQKERQRQWESDEERRVQSIVQEHGGVPLGAITR
jgi:hypothetical protein